MAWSPRAKPGVPTATLATRCWRHPRSNDSAFTPEQARGALRRGWLPGAGSRTRSPNGPALHSFYKPMLPRPAGRSRSRPAFLIIICHAAREKKPRDRPSLLRAFIAERHAEKSAHDCRGPLLPPAHSAHLFPTQRFHGCKSTCRDRWSPPGYKLHPSLPPLGDIPEATISHSSWSKLGVLCGGDGPGLLAQRMTGTAIQTGPSKQNAFRRFVKPSTGAGCFSEISKYLFPPISVYNGRLYPGNGEALFPRARG